VTYAQAPVGPTNTTQANNVPVNENDPRNTPKVRKGPAGAPLFITPPPVGSFYEGVQVVANKDDIKNLPQNQIGVYFTNGQAYYDQNVPQPYAGGADVLSSTQRCGDGVVNGTEVCDIALNICCDVQSNCNKWVEIDSPCNANSISGVIPRTLANLKCFKDSCQIDPNAATQRLCVREKYPALLTNGKGNKKGLIKILNGTACYGETNSDPPTIASVRLETRRRKNNPSKKNRRKNKKAKKNKKRIAFVLNNAFCDGTGLCKCTTCPTTVIGSN